MAAPYLIFGASGAIGTAIAAELAAKGHPVHLAGRDEARLTALSGQLSMPCSRFDALDAESIRQVVAEASQGGELAGLVWAVGSILLKPIGKLTEKDFSDCFSLNVTGAALAVQAALPALQAGQGSVLLFSSVAARNGFAAHSAIGAAKAGVEGLGLALAAELAPSVRVNVIAPSLSASFMSAGLTENSALAKALAKLHPLGRLGKADDFAPLARLLLEPQSSSWITGAVIPIDGGRASLHKSG
jgi:NAD(P)-dependent dehydrogenase (short-subunit alcohol dehydrogenase family)